MSSNPALTSILSVVSRTRSVTFSPIPIRKLVTAGGLNPSGAITAVFMLSLSLHQFKNVRLFM
jgi:hypothetical protein